MNISASLTERSNSSCELCYNNGDLTEYVVSPKRGDDVSEKIAICNTCLNEINKHDLNGEYWKCLGESMWSEVQPVKVVAYRLLYKLSANHSWALEYRDMMYLEEETLAWAEIGLDEVAVIHKDSNGNILENGDTVTLIKDLNVKGANFTAKRGTAVRRINLVSDNENQIEGNVEGQRIVILTEFVKKN